MSKTVAVIGGGASGMTAAIMAARNGAKVTIYERNDRIGKKILATGNGKCNLSNLSFNEEDYHSGDLNKVMTIFERFGVEDTIQFFREMGLLIKNKNGYLYPASEQAAVVLDILRLEIAHQNICVMTGVDVLGLKYNEENGQFYIEYCKDGKKEVQVSDKVILSCGSKAGTGNGKEYDPYRLAKGCGHSVVPIVPALVQLRTIQDMKAVAGVRMEANLTLYIDGQKQREEYGEVQLTEYGISGIPTFQLSRWVSYGLREGKKIKVQVDCLPNFSQSEYQQFKTIRMLTQGQNTVEDFFLGIVNKKLTSYFLKNAGLKPGMMFEEAEKEKTEKVFELLRDWELDIKSVNSFEQAQVCAGGVNMQEVDENLQSKILPGLFLTGEMLDVDGRCGGYNLQWAWSSGAVAGIQSTKQGK